MDIPIEPESEQLSFPSEIINAGLPYDIKGEADSLTTEANSIELEIITICDICRENNLTKKIKVSSCKECSRDYCVHFASSVDPSYCSDCLAEVSMEKSVIVRVTEHSVSGSKLKYQRRSSAVQIRFGGEDFLFYSRKIHTLSDLELELAIEYHHAIYSSMILERDQRRVEHFHRNAGVKVVPRVSTGAVASTKIVTTKSVTTSKVIKKSKAEINLASMLQALLASGYSVEDIKKRMT